MTGLRQPTRYNIAAPSSALNEISDSQANARAAAAMPPPPHGLKRQNTDYREPRPLSSTSCGVPRFGADRVSQTEAVQPDAKRKPPSLAERAGEYKPKSQLPPPRVPTAVATKATSIVNLTVSTLPLNIRTIPIPVPVDGNAILSITTRPLRRRSLTLVIMLYRLVLLCLRRD